MSLMDTFVQVFEFDTRQADSAFNKVQRSTDDIIEGMKQTQQAAEQSSLTFGSVMNDLWQSLQGLSGEYPIDFSTNADEVSSQTAEVKAQLDSVNTSLVALDEQRETTEAGWQLTQSTLSELDGSYQQLQTDVSQLNTGMTELAVTENQSVATKRLANAILQALQGNYKELIKLVDEAREKGIEAANSEVKAQSEVQKALDNTEAKYQKTGNTVISFAKKALGAVGLLMGATALVGESISRSAEIESLDKLGKKINVATADVDAFAGSMAALGGSRDAAQSDLTAMAKSFGFAKNSMEKVLKTADKVQGMKFDKAKATLAGLGVTDDKTVELMMKGRKELERMMGIQKEYSGISKESIEQSIKFNKAMQGFKQSSGLLKNSFLEMVIPILAKGLEWINKFVVFCKENKPLVVSFFTIIGAAITTYYVPAMLKAAKSTLLATWPILAIIAIIALLAAAFAFVYDDIMNFIDGNDSMIGRLLDKYPALKVVIMALWEAFKTLFDYLKIVVKFVADIVVDAYNKMNDALNKCIGWLVASVKDVAKWGQGFKGVFNTVSDAVIGIFKWLWAQIQQYLGWINDGLDAIKNGWSTVKGWFGFEDAEVTQTVERKISADGTIEHQISKTPTLSEDDTALIVQGLSQQINGMSANPMNPMTSQAISNQSSTTNENTVNVGELNINTQSTDAQGIAQDAKGELQSQLQDLGHQTSSGVGK
ncbi:hypothetical protein [Providencia heimbachae]|uniref:hypothetical protein n=1 Tax=Providencia heimbachae TaxID=333962 RepID=UPI00223FC1B9|nr:hypothetical protein [Providencia heimbachae]